MSQQISFNSIKCLSISPFFRTLYLSIFAVFGCFQHNNNLPWFRLHPTLTVSRSFMDNLVLILKKINASPVSRLQIDPEASGPRGQEEAEVLRGVGVEGGDRLFSIIQSYIYSNFFSGWYLHKTKVLPTPSLIRGKQITNRLK